MKKQNRHISIFLSNPCDITHNILVTSSSWYRFVSKLGSKNDCIEVISPKLEYSEDNFDIHLMKNKNYIKTDHFPYKSFKQYYINLAFFSCMFIFKYYQIMSRSDLIILRIPTPGFTILACMALLLGKPLVVFVSGDIVTQSDTFNTSSGITRFLLWNVLKLRVFTHTVCLKNANHVFAVSSDLINLYSLSRRENVVVARTPVISNREIVKKAKPRKSNETLRIVRVCWLQQSKGIENLIHSISKVSQHFKVRLDIFGAAKDEKFAEKIENLIIELGLTDIVFLKGWIPNNKLRMRYHEYDLHVMSSLSEGMPRVCMETAAKGVPQLITPVGGVQDFFTHMHDAYICRDCSSEALVEGILWFLKNNERGTCLAQNAINSLSGSTIEAFSDRFKDTVMKMDNLS